MSLKLRILSKTYPTNSYPFHLFHVIIYLKSLRQNYDTYKLVRNMPNYGTFLEHFVKIIQMKFNNRIGSYTHYIHNHAK